MSWIIAFVIFAAVVWLVPRLYLKSPDLSQFDNPRPLAANAGQPPSAAHEQVLQEVSGMFSTNDGQRGKARLLATRQAMDQMGAGFEQEGLKIEPTSANGVPAEWVLAEHSNPQHRLLYLHGGAFTLGSPKSHRRITARFATQFGFSVLSVDYRLMPEHKRLAGLEDSLSAYRWLADNGPAGPGPASCLVVAGDSAGGNLTLALLAQARDTGLRAADAAIALSPMTDATLASPSMHSNLSSDAMLGPGLQPLLKLPRSLLLWAAWLSARVRPTDPRVSPIHGPLHDLPPTLLLASECEMLRDDSIRYANKAQAAGSVANLVTWEHMVHVWQFFVPKLPEAVHSFSEMGTFLAEHTGVVEHTPALHESIDDAVA